MAPHLMRAQGAYKADKHATPTHTHTRMHIHTLTHTHHKNTSTVVMGLMETEERKREISRQKRRRGFSMFYLKEESNVACLTEKEREFQMTGPIY